MQRSRIGESRGIDRNEESESLSHSLENVINPQFMRTLRDKEVLALLTVGGHAYDDVLNTEAIYG